MLLPSASIPFVFLRLCACSLQLLLSVCHRVYSVSVSLPLLTGIGAVNDGGPGGEVLEGNLIFNFVAETGGALTMLRSRDHSLTFDRPMLLS